MRPGPSGIPEVSSGIPSPPESPPLAAYAAKNEHSISRVGKAQRMGAVYTIAEECERLFCETFRTVFLGERATAEDSLAMGAQTTMASDGYFGRYGQVREWVEVWDYVGGSNFRGFVAGDADDRTLIVFFDDAVVGKDLKQGLMALIELASTAWLMCSSLVVCLSRGDQPAELKSLMRDLGWVGFELITLDRWAHARDVTSDQYLLLGMDV
ncbi:MAG: hypothetical protein M1819_000994 [Sarea resinae]|nr:MAG: hypothetical protein M1819_000994 [Sarea resinae]